MTLAKYFKFSDVIPRHRRHPPPLYPFPCPPFFFLFSFSTSYTSNVFAATRLYHGYTRDGCTHGYVLTLRLRRLAYKCEHEHFFAFVFTFVGEQPFAHASVVDVVCGETNEVGEGDEAGEDDAGAWRCRRRCRVWRDERWVTRRRRRRVWGGRRGG